MTKCEYADQAFILVRIVSTGDISDWMTTLTLYCPAIAGCLDGQFKSGDKRRTAELHPVICVLWGRGGVEVGSDLGRRMGWRIA